MRQKICSLNNTKGSIFLWLMVVVGMAAFAMVFISNINPNVFLGAQAGKGGAATAPGAPTLRSATAGDGEVALAWNAPASDGGSAITGYSISYTDGKSPQTIATGNTNTSYTLNSLTNGTLYTFRVSAVNAVGTGSASSSLSATPQAAQQATVPDAPTGLSGTAGDSQIQLSWIAPANNGGASITGYVISYTPAGGGEETVDTGTSTSYTLTSLSNTKEYTVKVAAKNSEGTGDYSSTVTATPISTATVPGVPTGLTLTPGDGTIGVSWVAPNSNGGSAITGYTVSYTPSGGAEATTSVDQRTTSKTLTGLTNGTSYSIKVRAENAVGNGQYTSTGTSTPDQNIAPSIVGVPTVTPSNTGAVITWSTNKNTSTRVDFGLLTATSSTPEYNTSTRVVNHTVTISNLVPCTTYSYVVKSFDALSQSATSSEQTFTTTGCAVNAEIQEIKRDSVDTTVGGVIDFTDTDVKTKLTVPQNLKAGEEEVVFQVKLLEKQTVKQEIGLPTPGVAWLGDHVYNLAAYSSASETEVNDFDNPLTVTIEYSREDVSGIDLNTLVIHHYDEDRGWSALTNCENTYDPNTGEGQISCDTSSFSIFGLFGEGASGSSTGVYLPDYLSGGSSNENEGDAENETIVTTTEALVVIPEDVIVPVPEEAVEEIEQSDESFVTTFSQDLWYGVPHRDVMNLQRFLNTQGFILAKTGPGSPGKETGYFGPRTFRALKEFQTFYRESIIAPSSFQKATGYLDYFTRQFIQENF